VPFVRIQAVGSSCTFSWQEELRALFIRWLGAPHWGTARCLPSKQGRTNSLGELESENLPKNIAKFFQFDILRRMSVRCWSHYGHSTPVKQTAGRCSRLIRLFCAGAPAFFLAISSVFAQATEEQIVVRFDQSTYQVAPNGIVSVGIVITPPASGLFSYGVRLNLPPGKAAATSSDSIEVPSPLDFNGVFGPGALRTVDAAGGGVKGTVNIDPLVEAYRNALIATFNLENRVGTVGASYPLTLDLFRTLGPAESIFVDGLGNTLDQRIVFGTAMVTVVPEPSLMALLGLPLVMKFLTSIVSRPEVRTT
jgi:hypothetical protein